MRHLPAHLRSDRCIDQFLCNRLPRCDCPGGARRVPQDQRTALMPVLEIVAPKTSPRATAPTGLIADEPSRYDTHTSNAGGLAGGTRRGCLRIIERLLMSQFARPPVVASSLNPGDVRQFIGDQLQRRGTTSNAITIASTLRAYLRYRATCGDAVQPQLAVIASPAHWSMGSLPRGLKPEELDRLLNSFADALPSPKRGYAVVRRALNLAARHRHQPAETAPSTGAWAPSRLNARKSRRQDLLPAPVVTGRPLEAYPCHERSKTNDNAAFVRRVAAHGEPIGVAAIRRVVRDAFWRVGTRMAAAMRCATRTEGIPGETRTEYHGQNAQRASVP